MRNSAKGGTLTKTRRLSVRFVLVVRERFTGCPNRGRSIPSVRHGSNNSRVSDRIFRQRFDRLSLPLLPPVPNTRLASRRRIPKRFRYGTRCVQKITKIVVFFFFEKNYLFVYISNVFYKVIPIMHLRQRSFITIAFTFSTFSSVCRCAGAFVVYNVFTAILETLMPLVNSWFTHSRLTVDLC